MSDLIEKNKHGNLHSSLVHEFSSLANRFFGHHPHRHHYFREGIDFVPSVDVVEGKDDVLIRVDLPGFKKEDIEISADDHMITVSGSRKDELRDEYDLFLLRERDAGGFERKIHLPDGIAQDEISAEYKDGVLTLKLKKNAVQKRIKRIDIS